MVHHNNHCWKLDHELNQYYQYQVRKRNASIKKRVFELMEQGYCYGTAMWKAVFGDDN